MAQLNRLVRLDRHELDYYTLLVALVTHLVTISLLFIIDLVYVWKEHFTLFTEITMFLGLMIPGFIIMISYTLLETFRVIYRDYQTRFRSLSFFSIVTLFLWCLLVISSIGRIFNGNVPYKSWYIWILLIDIIPIYFIGRSSRLREAIHEE